MEQLTRLISGTKAFESLWKQFSADKFAHAYLVTSVDPVYLHEFWFMQVQWLCAQRVAVFLA
ncbi:MAG: hypothetical protein IKA90_03360 [Clostridia bacterium]|nr:hypothetical protein [Clostridia bacterium]